ncbi:Nif3-like dinuclear metal center hexameric protein [Neiella marina]|uniref:Nif3-like dinuclear metal center hexameric protein n=1 Tax=Neiella holothuriorum TaxID=2870530 RepID=A0ABS7EE06_9GAMM|nr:Nif3-like dinuclear metal center hexameric protein [Neiella holothuriorum]MBW8190163.1 Nif3-like dinuclear metal center hexameric protein [Neiella holothuriorum]
MKRQQLIDYLDELLQADKIRDYCPNGLQVQGRDDIQKVVTGVTASQALIDAAIAANADAVLVHHGYFWKNESPVITGMKYNRLKALLDANINLIGYHLPLDVHPELGNNAQLAKRLNIVDCVGLDPNDAFSVAMKGRFAEPISGSQLSQSLLQLLNRKPLHIDVKDQPLQTVGWCTGGGQSFIEQAALADCDVFITGEVSEQTVHVARELNIDFIAAGHHATERYGVEALGHHLAQQLQLQLDVQFIDIDNPA